MTTDFSGRPEEETEARLACGRDIELVVLLIADSWARATGPIFVTDGKSRGVVHCIMQQQPKGADA
ncbi:MAG: agmatine deiminase family protein [Parvibaculum sp.]|nr:agmatine deiminase family protein [Parvibaculum sp.]